MADKVYPKCEALSQLKKTLIDKEFYHFWSVILWLMKEDNIDKFKETEVYYESIMKYYCVGRKEKNEVFKLMELTAKHYGVYDLFLQTFRAAYEKDTRKLSPNVIDLICKTAKDDVLRDDYMKYLSTIRESLDAIEPEFYSLLNSPASTGKKTYSNQFEHELYHQLRQHDISLPKDYLTIQAKGDSLLNNLCKLAKRYEAHVDSDYEISLPIFVYSKNLVESIKKIPINYRIKLHEITKKTDIVCYYRPSGKTEPPGNTKATFACKTLREVLSIVK